jgi:hypothetical protein
MSGDLCRFLAAVPSLFEVFTNLLTPWAGSVEVLLRVSLDLRGTAPPAFDLIPKLA